MKKHSDERSAVAPLEVPGSKRPAKPRVRYEGFESLRDGRRLQFSVQSSDDRWVETVVYIPDAVFSTVRGFSFQDAAPMVYEKIVGVLDQQGNLDDFSLTETDIREYIDRHTSSQKRLWAERRGRSDTAA